MRILTPCKVIQAVTKELRKLMKHYIRMLLRREDPRLKDWIKKQKRWRR